MAAVGSVLSSALPSIDEHLFGYIQGILDGSKDDFQSCDEVYEAIGEVLHEVASDKTEDDIKSLCSHLLLALKSDTDEDTSEGKHKVLNAPVHLGKMAEQFEIRDDEVKSIWIKQRDSTSLVDQKKLEKAEAKLKLKQEKREGAEKPTPSVMVNKLATACQAINRKDTKLEVKGTNRIVSLATCLSCLPKRSAEPFLIAVVSRLQPAIFLEAVPPLLPRFCKLLKISGFCLLTT